MPLVLPAEMRRVLIAYTERMTPLAKDELTGPRGAAYRRMIELSVAGRARTPDESQ